MIVVADPVNVWFHCVIFAGETDTFVRVQWETESCYEFIVHYVMYVE